MDVHAAGMPPLDLLAPLSAIALCVLFAWGFTHGSGDGVDDATGIDSWQLAVGCVIVATLVSWYAGTAGI